MPYATRQQMEQLIGTDAYVVAVPGATAALQDAAADSGLESASGIADTYIARWLPLAVPTPPALREAVIWIATYNLAGDGATENMRKRYEDAMRWLRDVADGKASLGVLSTPGTSGGSAELTARGRHMTRCTLRGVL